MSEFFQNPPQLDNTYQTDRWLKAYLRYKLPAEMMVTVDADLQNLGARCATDYLELARRAEREKPEHIAYDAWGKRIDQVRVSTAWDELQNVSAREGMVAIGYQRQFGEFSRLYQFAKLYLYHPSSAFATCPLAMCDGAARVLEVYGKTPELQAVFRHLTSNKPEEFWTSGQWMTERSGGSDVSGTETIAKLENGKPRLYGTKWFTSSITSQMALALGRYEDSQAGSRGLTLFYVNTYSSPGVLNNIQVLRLKDKMGTVALPTSELKLEGAYATQVGERDQGVKTVATMLNITRLYNAICALGSSARGLMLIRDYSSRRKSFGQHLTQHPLHFHTFAAEEMKTLAGFVLTMEMIHLLGKDECKKSTTAEADILRMMTPISKMFTAKASTQVASEVIEGFGGVGYCEDSGIPVQLRDNQVFSIWEGATNVLSLDLVRAIQKTEGLKALKEDVVSRLSALKGKGLDALSEIAKEHLLQLEKNLELWAQTEPASQMISSRSLAFYLGRLYAFVLLLSWAGAESEANQKVLRPWLEQYANGYIGEWTVASTAESSRIQSMWSERLKV